MFFLYEKYFTMVKKMYDRIHLTDNITPLYKLNYTSENVNIYMKRDDLIDFAFGGNKVRLFDYLASDIIESKAKRVVTYGSTYSNFVRVTVAVCAKFGWNCDIIILDEMQDVHGGNEILIGMFDNVNLLHCSSKEANAFIHCYKEKLKKEGVQYYWVPGGGHSPCAAMGYVRAADEIKTQVSQLNIHLDAVFLPCGTGTTQAGLIYGFQDDDTDIIGISIARDETRCINEIKKLLQSMRDEQNSMEQDISFHISAKKYDDLEYGQQNAEIRRMSQAIAVSDGIFLDPVYNARAFWGMTKVLENRNYHNVLYLNTGGQPNIFMQKGHNE